MLHKLHIADFDTSCATELPTRVQTSNSFRSKCSCWNRWQLNQLYLSDHFYYIQMVVDINWLNRRELAESGLLKMYEQNPHPSASCRCLQMLALRWVCISLRLIWILFPISGTLWYGPYRTLTPSQLTDPSRCSYIASSKKCAVRPFESYFRPCRHRDGGA